MNRVQRGFHKFGIISAVATLLLGVALCILGNNGRQHGLP